MVSSVKFSKNTKYILSSGKDGGALLWELASARPLNTYQPSNVKLLPYRPCALFNHTENYVLMQEEKMQQLVLSWNARTTQLLAPVVSGTLFCSFHHFLSPFPLQRSHVNNPLASSQPNISSLHDVWF
jgi:hypothetical protein